MGANSSFFTRAGDRITVVENLRQRLAQQKGLLQLVDRVGDVMKEPIAHPGVGGRTIISADFGRVIGLDNCVEAERIGLDDLALFSLIPGHHEPVRVLTDTDPHPANTLTMALQGTNSGFALLAAWVGRQTPKQPHDITYDDPYGQTRELTFWQSHALVYQEGWEKPWPSTWRTVIEEALEAA